MGGFGRPPSMFRQSLVRAPPAPARALRSLEGDLDDTTLALPFFGGGKTESKPAKKSAPKEASGGDGQWLTDFLGRLGGGATPTTGQSKPMRGQRVVVRKAEPTQGFEHSGFVRPPSMFRQSLVRDPPAPARALRSLEGDLDDTTLAFFGGKTEKESKPTKKSAPKEANDDPIGNFLSRIGGGATPLSTGQ